MSGSSSNSVAIAISTSAAISLWEISSESSALSPASTAKLVKESLVSLKSTLPQSKCTSIKWSKNGNVLASSWTDGKIRLSHASGSLLAALSGPDDSELSSVDFSSGSRYLAAGGASATVHLWDLKKKDILKSFQGHASPILSVRYHSNDTLLGSSASSGDILLHNITSSQTSAKLRVASQQPVNAISFSQLKKSLLVSGCDAGAVTIFDINTSKALTSFAMHAAPVSDVACSTLNQLLVASAGLDKHAFIYDLNDKSAFFKIACPEPLVSISFSETKPLVALAGTSGGVFVYDVRAGSAAPLTSFRVDVSDGAVARGALFRPIVEAGAALLSSSSSSSSATSTAAPTTKRDAPSKTAAPPGASSSSASMYKAALVHQALETNNSQPRAAGSSALPAASAAASSDAGGGIFSPIRTKAGQPIEPPSPLVNAQAFASPAVTRTVSQETDAAGPAGALYSHHSSGSAPPGEIFSPIAATKFSSAVVDSPVAAASSAPFSSMLTPTGENFKASAIRAQSTPANLPPGAALPSELGKGSSLFTPAAKTPATARQPQSEGESPIVSVLKTPSALSGTVEQNNRIMTQVHMQLRSSAGQAFTPSATLGADRFSRTLSDTLVQKVSATVSGDPLFKDPEQSDAGAEDSAAPGSTVSLEFQTQFIRSVVEECLDDFRQSVHEDIQNMHLELLRQFQIQRNELEDLIKAHSINESLLREIDKLKLENERLRQAQL